MADMKKSIWLVSTGCYSDFEIESAWSTEELAEARVKELKRVGGYGGGDEHVWEYDIDTADDLSDRQFRHAWVNQEGKAGVVSGLEKYEEDRVRFFEYDNTIEYSTWIKECDDATAIKIAKERWRGTEVQEKIARTRRIAAGIGNKNDGTD